MQHKCNTKCNTKKERILSAPFSFSAVFEKLFVEIGIFLVREGLLLIRKCVPVDCFESGVC